MRNKNIFFVIFFFFLISCQKKNVELTKLSENIDALSTDLICLYQIPLEKIKIMIYGKKQSDKKYDDKKKLVILNEKGDCLVETSVYLSDTDPLFSFNIQKTQCGLKLKFKKNPRHRFIFFSDNYPYMKEYPIKDYWIASSLVGNNYILYSTEFDNSTIKKIDLKTGDIQRYEGWFPNVELYKIVNTNSLGVFSYENQWFEILDDKIIPSNRTYNPVKKKSFHEYRITN